MIYAQFFCAGCGHLLFESKEENLRFVAKEHLPCPSCGGRDIRGGVLAEEKVAHFDQLSIKAKDASGVTVKMKIGGSLSKDGTVASVEQVVDKRSRTYKKKVTLADGTVVKDVEGPLEDQSLHGHGKKSG